MSQTPVGSVVMFAAAALVGAVGQYCYQSGAVSSNGTLGGYLLNWRIATGVACYIAVMVLFIGAFRLGGSLTVLYPVYASTFIFAAVIAWWAHETPIRWVNVAGMLLMIAGMYLMGRGK